MKDHVEFDVCDIPFYGYYAPQAPLKRRHFGCSLRRHNYDRPEFGPVFDHGPENQRNCHHGPQDKMSGPPGDGHKGWGMGNGPPKQDYNGPPNGFYGSPNNFYGPPNGFYEHPGYRGHDARPHEFHGHGPSSYFGPHPGHWFGPRGPTESGERAWGPPHQSGSWEGTDHHRPQ